MARGAGRKLHGTVYMLTNLAVTIAMGAIGAGIVFLIAHLTGWKKPGSAYLIAAAAGMLGFAIYDEYSWFDRAVAGMPTTHQVVRSYGTSIAYQPWTFAVPRIYKFDAVDMASARANPKAPDLLLIKVLRVTRNVSSEAVTTLVECRRSRFAEITPLTTFDDAGLPSNADWQSLDDHPQMRAVVCAA